MKRSLDMRVLLAGYLQALIWSIAEADVAKVGSGNENERRERSYVHNVSHRIKKAVLGP